MFPRNQRVTTNLFKEIGLKGKRLDSLRASISFIRTSSSDPLKFAVVTPKKVFRTAVSRNSVKRKVLTYVREVFGHDKGYATIVFLKQPLSLEWKGEISDLIGRIKKLLPKL